MVIGAMAMAAAATTAATTAIDGFFVTAIDHINRDRRFLYPLLSRTISNTTAIIIDVAVVILVVLPCAHSPPFGTRH